MNCLNYEPIQNLNRMYTNKNVCPFFCLSVLHSTKYFHRTRAVPFNAMFWISSAVGFPGINSISLLKLSLIVPKAPTTTVTTFVLTFHILEISICRSLYFDLFSVAFSTHSRHQVHPQSSNFVHFCSGLLGLFARNVLSFNSVLLLLLI